MTNVDANVVEALFRVHYRALRAFAAGISPGDPDDSVQEALVRLFSRVSETPVEDPIAYLRRTIANIAIDNARRERSNRKALERVAGAGTTTFTPFP